MRHARTLFVIAAFLPALVSCDQATVDIPSVPDPIGWTLLDEFESGPIPSDVWGSGANDVYAGYVDYSRDDYDVLRHFDGTRWEPVRVPEDLDQVRGIWGSASDDVYVAAPGFMWHFDGASWNRTEVNAHLVTGHDAGHVIAASATHLVRFNGAAWDTLLVITKPESFVRALWAGPASSIVAYIGNYPEADSLIRHGGNAWSPAEPVPGRFNASWGTSENGLIAVGRDANGGAAWQWDGAQWAPMVVPFVPILYDVYGLPTGDVYAGGCNQLLHYDGNSWQTLHASEDECFQDVWASSTSDVYAIGRNLSRYDGVALSPIFPVRPQEPTAVWADSRGRVVVGDDRSIFRLENGTWTEEVQGMPWGTIYSLEGRSWDDLYAGTSGGVYHGDGQDWTPVPDSPGSVDDMVVLETGELIVTDRFRIFRHDASGWTEIRNALEEAEVKGQYALWAFTPDDVLSGGDDGVSRFDGVSWKRIDDEDCHDLFAFSPTDVYALGPYALRHSDGGAFQRVGPVLPGYFEHVTGTSPDHIIAVGREGYIAYQDGAWVVGSEPGGDYNIALVPAASDGSIIRLDRFSGRVFRMWYHQE